MFQDFQDVAQICLNGHIVNSAVRRDPQFCEVFCHRCGAETIVQCQNCDAGIPGEYHIGESFPGRPRPISHHVKGIMFHIPAYCIACGKPFPWTKAMIKTARDLTKELDDISNEDKNILIRSYNDIVIDTPKTKLASQRIKIILARAKKSTAEILKRMLSDIAIDAAKKLIGLN